MSTKQISGTQVRALQREDLKAALELSTIAGWNQTAEDWRMLLDLAPHGCFAIDVNGQVVSTTTVICYGKSLAWIGMVLTNPEFRGRGLARRLVTHALEYADAQGIETVKLDATDQGKDLYEALGFRAEQAVERWSRAGVASLHDSDDSAQCTIHEELDREAFGIDRLSMLESLAQRSKVRVGSRAYLFTRPGRVLSYLGPCVAANREAASLLLAKVVNAVPTAGWSWDLLPANQDAVALASTLGFSRQRQLTRMARGKILRGCDEMVYAIAGFELG